MLRLLLSSTEHETFEAAPKSSIRLVPGGGTGGSVRETDRVANATHKPKPYKCPSCGARCKTSLCRCWSTSCGM